MNERDETHFEPNERRRDKQSARDADVESLRSGSVTAIALQSRNGIASALASGGDTLLDADEARRLLSHLKAADGVFVVGGQAISIWAHHFGPVRCDLTGLEPYSTRDVDYFGDLAAARKLASVLGGVVRKPSIDTMNSVSTAMVEVPLGGRTVVVDFLHGIIGVERREFKTGVVDVDLPDGQGGILSIPVMHPVLCVKSRIGNMLSAATRRRDVITTNQAKASLVIVRSWIETALESGEHKEAVTSITAMVGYCEQDTFGRRAHSELGVDPLEVPSKFLQDDRLDVRWRERTLGPAIRRVTTRRDRRAERIATAT